MALAEAESMKRSSYTKSVISLKHSDQSRILDRCLPFSKAFDRVDYKIVLSKCPDVGICGKLVLRIEYFLENGTHIAIGRIQPSQARVKSGVP